MAENKKTIFLSHSSRERRVAELIKEKLEEKFLGAVEVFVSSAPDSIPLGTRWNEQIDLKLKECEAAIILASPASLTSPWIWYEVGAISAQDKQVIPVCFGGMTPDKIPQPLSNYQAAVSTDEYSLRGIFGVVSDILGLEMPKLDWRSLANKIKSIEEDVVLWESLKVFVALAQQYNKNFLKSIDTKGEIEMPIPELSMGSVGAIISGLQAQGIFVFEEKGMAIGSPGGFSRIFSVRKGSNFEIIKSERSPFKDAFD